MSVWSSAKASGLRNSGSEAPRAPRLRTVKVMEAKRSKKLNKYNTNSFLLLLVRHLLLLAWHLLQEVQNSTHINPTFLFSSLPWNGRGDVEFTTCS